ncbi:MAG: alpha/beta hydrolase [Deltaproteobacteria bacterium]|nr:alpha/beta hydrolase [Deltaproteobacteria bacterium]
MGQFNWRRLSKPFLTAVGLVCLTLLGCFTILFASPGYTMETNTYIINQAEKPVGREVSRIVEDSSGIKLSSNVNLTILQQKLALESAFVAVLDLDVALNPISYTLKGQLYNEETAFEITFGPDQASAMGRSVPIHKNDLLVLDNMLTSHFSILLRRYRANGTPVYRFHAFIPQVMQEIQATMTAKGSIPVRMGEENSQLERYHVVLGSSFLELWADDSDRVMRVSVPSQKLVFVNENTVSFEKMPEKQERSKQSSVITEEIVFKSDDILLSGAVHRPKGIDKVLPAVLFLSGSGRQDRDGQSPDSPINLQSGKIASHLATAGSVVLTYDDRGVGLSKNCCENIYFGDEIQDAEAALTFLRSRPHVNPDRIFLIGHSAGSIIAAKLAGRHSDIAGVFLMAPPGRPLRKILVDQAKNVLKLNNASEEQEETALRQQQAVFAFIESYREGQEIPPPFLPQKTGLIWLKELLDYDPLQDYAALTCPILILWGEKDLQITREDIERITAMLKKSGHHSFSLKQFPELDHLFMPSTDGNIAEYYNGERSLAPQLLETLTTWIKALSK